MGLDMYLRARTNVREYKGATGACNGLFGIAPEDDDMVEIGYWRKAYDQRKLIEKYGEETEYGIYLSLDNVKNILDDAKNILKTHTFNEFGDDISIQSDTYYCEEKWKDTIKFFEEAEKIYNEDPNAKIYYLAWE